MANDSMIAEVYRNRDGLFVARVTITDPNWDGRPYGRVPKLVETTTRGRKNRSDALLDANHLAESMTVDAEMKAK